MNSVIRFLFLLGWALSGSLLATPVIISPNLVTGTAGSALSYQIVASGSAQSYGATGLPAGLSISSSLGSITGIPLQSGSYNAILSASTAASTGTAALTLVMQGSGLMEVPLTQYQLFFNDDLEIYDPAPIILSGLIHSNKALYLSVSLSSNLQITGKVSTAGTAVFYQPSDPKTSVPGYSTEEPPLAIASNFDRGTLSPPTWNNGGISSQLRQITPVYPLAKGLETLFASAAASTNPNPNLANGYHEMLEMPDLTDLTANPDPMAAYRLFNQAGLIIKISGTTRSGTTKSTVTTAGTIKIKPYTSADVAITTATVDLATRETSLTPIAGFPVLVAANNGAALPVYDSTTTAANQTAAYKSAIANIAAALTKQLAADASNGLTAMYDQRVGANVNVTNVDVGALGTVISSNVTGAFNNVVYIQDATVVGAQPADGVTTDGVNNNTVRLVNGKVLPDDGLTIASPNPVYIQGDYNTGYGAPSTANPATVDVSTNTAYGSLSSKNTGNTTSGGSTPYTRSVSAVVGDAVMLLSNAWNDLYSPVSQYSHRAASNTTYNTAIMGGYMPSKSGSFSGGAVNYPRFLENWSAKGCVYWGSMVELFPSKTFTQLWQGPGTYYIPPNRYFNFDPYFLSNAPPGRLTGFMEGQAPSLFGPSVVTGATGTAFHFQLQGSNWPTSFSATGLPPGLYVYPMTAEIMGTPTQSGTFDAIISAANGSGTGSAPLRLTIYTRPEVTAHPTGQTILPGSTAQFSAAATGSPTPTVQWQVSATGTGGAFSNLTGNATATTGTLTLTAVAIGQDRAAYRAVFTNVAGSATSGPATLRVYTAPVLNVPANLTATATSKAGAIADYTATANDSVDGVLTPICTPSSGSTFPIGVTTVSCSAMNGGGLVSSGTFTVTVRRSFAAFQDQQGMPDADPAADPSQTGVSNLAAYAFGLNPAAPERSQLPSADVHNGSLQISYPRWKDAADLQYVVEVSGDLQTWNSGTDYTEEVSVTPIDDTREQVLERDLIPASNALRRFIRIRLIH